MPLVELLEALNIKQQADALFPAPGSNHSYDNSTIVNTFVLMLNEGASCLEDVYHLHTEAELLKLLGIQELPGADTLARWLHRHGEAGVPLVGEISRRVIASVPEADWKPLRLRDGSLSQHQWVARRTHIMNNSDTSFNLIMQRCRKSEVADLPEQRELPGLSIETQYETDKYIYRVIATNIEGLDDSQISY